MKNPVIIFLTFVVFSHCTNKVEISQWRGPDRDGIYHETNLLEKWPEDGPVLIWKYDELGSGYASAAVVDDFVFTAGTVDSITYIFKFDHTGNVIWKKEIGAEWMTNFPGIRSTPLIYGDLGYLLNGLGKLFCFNTKNGDIVWKRDLFTEFDGRNNFYGITENLVIDRDRLFCTPGGVQDNVIALNRFTGELIWTCKGNSGISDYSSPILIDVADEKYIIVHTDTSLLSVNIRNGNLAWKYNLQNSDIITNLPLYRDGDLFIMGSRPWGSLMLKLASDGKSVKKVWNSEYVNSSTDGVLVGNYIYAANWMNRTVSCIDWNTGDLIDSVGVSRMPKLIAADGLFYAYDRNGEFSLLKHDENGLQIVSIFRIEGGIENQHCSHPVIHNGRLYIRHDNSLFVYNISKSKT